MQRITNNMIQHRLDEINELMQTPMETFFDRKHVVGNIHTYDNAVVQTKNESGGIAYLARTSTKREAYEHLVSMCETVRQFRLHRGI